MSTRDPGIVFGVFAYSQIAIVASVHDSVARFKDLLVMKHKVEFPGDESHDGEFEIDVIIMKRDLLTIAKGIAIVDINSRHTVGPSRHEITIFNPFVKTPSPNFLLNVKNMGHLLEPYLTRLRGFEDVKVQGEIDEDLAKSMVAKMNSEPPLPSPPKKLLDKLIAWKSRGDQSFLEHDFNRAILYWNAAQLSI
ncbi:hypothetical protein DHEL01_v210421 [Diaporthe helianthi]|uniref:Uncharacterized protein n=1 Tax=Diaporthe helianthi TaxID=158607 RepID=A0A2P5HLP1_DIAHE|nr:hypothetical protein DHEL01_v210421 [Diaporthe helianthi]